MTQKKYVVWYHNFVNRADDDWLTVWAENAEEATAYARQKMESHRFYLGRCYTIQEFTKMFGKDWTVGKGTRIPRK